MQTSSLDQASTETLKPAKDRRPNH